MALVFHELCSMLFILATFTSKGICVCNPPPDVDDDEFYKKRKLVVIISPVDIVDNFEKCSQHARYPHVCAVDNHGTTCG